MPGINRQVSMDRGSLRIDRDKLVGGARAVCEVGSEGEPASVAGLTPPRRRGR